MSTIHEETNNTGDPEHNAPEIAPSYIPPSDEENQNKAGLLDNAQPDPRVDTDAEGSDGSSEVAQEGVKKSEGMAMAWSTASLNIAYLGAFLLSAVVSLEGNTTSLLLIVATSAFAKHSQTATVTVIQQVTTAVAKAPIAKFADAVGRFEAYVLTMILWAVGFAIYAGAKDVSTLAAAQFFQSIGSTGNQILLQVFIADTSDLLNRALWSTLPDVPYLATTWIGPELSGYFQKTNWRWGYGMWAIAIPASFLPLGISMYINQRKAAKEGIIREAPGYGLVRAFTNRRDFWDLVVNLDIPGIFLLVAGLALLLVPVTLANNSTTLMGSTSGWNSPAIITPIVIGGVFLIAFPFWESKKKGVPFPLVPLRMLKDRTVACGCILGFFYFMAFYLSVFPYFSTYLQVVHYQSVPGAGRLVSIFTFSCTISALVTSWLIKKTKHYKYFIVAGTFVYMTGFGLMIKYRSEGASIASIIGNQICIGVGGGMINVPVQLGIQASVPHQNVAGATALFLVVLEVGGAVGAAISGAIWNRNLAPKLMEYLPEASKGMATTIAGNYLQAATFPKGSVERNAINRAYDETLYRMLIVAVAMVVPLLPLALLMKNHKLDEIDQHVKGRVIGGVVDEKGEKVDDGGGWLRWMKPGYWRQDGKVSQLQQPLSADTLDTSPGLKPEAQGEEVVGGPATPGVGPRL